MRLVLLPGAQPEDSFLPLPSPATPAHTPLDVSQEFICLSPCLSLPDRLCLSPPPFSLNSIYLQCLSVCLSPSHPSCAAVSLISLPFCGSFVLYVPLSLYLSECLFASWAVYLSVSLSVSQSLSQSVPCLSACFVPSHSLSAAPGQHPRADGHQTLARGPCHHRGSFLSGSFSGTTWGVQTVLSQTGRCHHCDSGPA